VIIVDSENMIKYVECVPEVTNAVNFDAAIDAVKRLI
jgi:thiol peroxidase